MHNRGTQQWAQSTISKEVHQNTAGTCFENHLTDTPLFSLLWPSQSIFRDTSATAGPQKTVTPAIFGVLVGKMLKRAAVLPPSSRNELRQDRCLLWSSITILLQKNVCWMGVINSFIALKVINGVSKISNLSHFSHQNWLWLMVNAIKFCVPVRAHISGKTIQLAHTNTMVVFKSLY